MSDIKKILTDEIRRLAKKEIKLATDPLNAKIVSLKKQISELSKLLKPNTTEAKQPTQNELSTQNEQARKIRLNASSIKKIREKFNLTQDAISIILGVSKAAYCTWEQNRQVPSLKMKKKIIALRKISPAQLKKIIADMGIKQGIPRNLKTIKKEKIEAPIITETPIQES